jgi:hypothetical protein
MSAGGGVDEKEEDGDEDRKVLGEVVALEDCNK